MLVEQTASSTGRAEPRDFLAPGYKLFPDHPSLSESAIPRGKARDHSTPPPLICTPYLLTRQTFLPNITFHSLAGFLSVFIGLFQKRLCALLFSNILPILYNRQCGAGGSTRGLGSDHLGEVLGLSPTRHSPSLSVSQDESAKEAPNSISR